uniref:L1 transposable element RRM domain-containing protein n=1 Tax=Latimeria chalumnae TaxID=7897 RepID=H2ZVM8_LATCH
VPTDIKNIVALLNGMSATLNEIKETNASLLQRIMVAEQQITDTEDEQHKMADNSRDLQKQIDALRLKSDDQENCSRRNNLRVVGFPENVEQGKPIKFLLETLPGLLKLPEDIVLDIERAPKPAAGQRPMPFIIRFLRFQVKERLLAAARELGMMEWQGSKIQLFPDLSSDLQECRRRFILVKQKLMGPLKRWNFSLKKFEVGLIIREGGKKQREKEKGGAKPLELLLKGLK